MRQLRKLIVIGVVLILLAACGNEKEDTMMDVAESFVQALIDGDKETLKRLNGDPRVDPDILLYDFGSDFSGSSLEAIDFELIEEDNEVKIAHEKGGSRKLYWIRIEEIGGKLLVTNM